MRLFISHTINPNPTVNFHFIDLSLLSPLIPCFPARVQTFIET